MNIYKISQTEHNDYDTYDSAVVVAEDEESAKKINPSGSNDAEWWKMERSWNNPWITDLSKIKVKLIGEADDSVEKGVVVASFNAG